MTDRVAVPFAGAEEGVGGLTWAQRGLWRAMEITGSSLPLGGTTPLPPGTTVAQVADALGYLYSRHPSLRTRLRLRPGDPEQAVAAAGSTTLAVVDAGGADPDAVAADLLAELERAPFDYEGEWPARWAVVCAGEAPTHMVAVYCHLALDLKGLEVLLDDLAGSPAGPVAAVSPLTLARQQAQPPALRQSAASLRHWDAALRRIPAGRFGGPADPRQPRWREVSYSSVAALHAARLLAARTDVTTGPVLLAACATALVRVTGVGPAVLQQLVNNRFRPGFARAVTPLSQSALASVDTAGASFDEVVDRSRRAIVQSAKNAYYDPYRLDEVFARADLDRGEPVDVDLFYNDRRRSAGHDDPVPVPTPADVRAAAPLSRTVGGRWLEVFDHRLFIHVDDVPDMVQWTVCADSRHLAPAAAEALLHEMEATLVAAALDS